MSNTNNDTFKVKDFLIEFGHAYQITGIKSVTDKNGEKDKQIQYQTHFPKDESKRITCTINQSELIKTKTRKPISQKDARAILQSLSKSKPPITDENIIYDNILNQNNVFHTSVMVKELWQEKQDPETNLSGSKSDLFQAGLDQMSQEFAVIFNKEPNEARKKIVSSLQK